MTLLKCFTLLMLESRLIKEEAERGRIFISHVKERLAVTLICCTSLTNIAIILRFMSTCPKWSLPLRFPFKF